MSTICFEVADNGSIYGIRVDGTSIIAISEFTDGNLPEFFQQITEQEYYSLIANVNIFSKYEGGQLVTDTDAENLYIQNQTENIRFRKQDEIMQLQQKVAMLAAINENQCHNHFQQVLNQKIQEYNSQYPDPLNCSNI